MPWALFQNPWISHFRHSASSHAVPGDSATATKTMRKAEKTPLHLQENEEVESRQLEEAPNAITQKKSHRQSPSPTTMIREFFPFFPPQLVCFSISCFLLFPLFHSLI